MSCAKSSEGRTDLLDGEHMDETNSAIFERNGPTSPCTPSASRWKSITRYRKSSVRTRFCMTELKKQVFPRLTIPFGITDPLCWVEERMRSSSSDDDTCLLDFFEAFGIEQTFAADKPRLDASLIRLEMNKRRRKTTTRTMFGAVRCFWTEKYRKNQQALCARSKANFLKAATYGLKFRYQLTKNHWYPQRFQLLWPCYTKYESVFFIHWSNNS